MPDTQRTLSAILALLADNTAGDISAQDVRDFAVSADKWASDYAAPFGKVPGGRLTLESGVPVPITDQSAKTRLFYTPYVHDQLWLYDGSSINRYTFSEFYLDAPSLTAGKNYDVFCYPNGSTPTLELSAAWSTDTARADALAWQAGLGWVKSGAATRFWLGTIRASATNQMSMTFGSPGTACNAYLWNAHNRVPCGLMYADTTNSWTYTTATWRLKNNSTVNQFNVICGLPSSILCFDNTISQNTGAGNGRNTGFGVDATNAISDGCLVGFASSPSNENTQHKAMLRSVLSSGYHYVAGLERSSATGTTTWYGDAGDATAYLFGGLALWHY